MGSFGWAIARTASTTAWTQTHKQLTERLEIISPPNSHTKFKFVSDQTLHEGGPVFSVLTSVSRSASSLWTLVLREVRATFSRVSLSISWVTFTSSRVARAFSFAASNPSAMILGWRPLKRNMHTLIRFKIFLMRFDFRPLFLPLTHRGQPVSGVLQWWGRLRWFHLLWYHPVLWQLLQWVMLWDAEFATKQKSKIEFFFPS